MTTKRVTVGSLPQCFSIVVPAGVGKTISHKIKKVSISCYSPVSLLVQSVDNQGIL